MPIHHTGATTVTLPDSQREAVYVQPEIEKQESIWPKAAFVVGLANLGGLAYIIWHLIALAPR